ncbi:MAG TPA: serine/threonine-protein kinase [Polyangiaceae bacterium]
MDLPVREGDVVLGKYAIERVLGEGGMGFVVAARHLELGERVALKFLLPEAAKLPEACLRFVREARAAARVKGEHVARVLDVGTRDDGMPFIVMEYLEGQDLGRLVETHGPLAVTDAVHYVLQACEAVAQAHAVGIVHRDLKPANLFLTTSTDGSPLVKVLDFGISKTTSVFTQTLSPDLTTVNASVGTPQYMSPEQARDAGKVDVRTDVWGLGTILFELLSARPAFYGEDLPAIVMMIATEEPPELDALRRDVPVALAAVVRRCLKKNRDERFANVAELARALEPFGTAEARGSVARVARILGHDSVPPTTVETPASVPAKRGGSAGFVLAAATIAVLGAGAWSQRSSLSAVVSTAPARPPAHAPAARPKPPDSPPPGANATPALAPAAALPTAVASGRSEAPREPGEVASIAPTTKEAPPSERTRAPVRPRGFDATKAATELFAAAERAYGCTKPGAPSGAGRAKVTFAPNGTVSRVSFSAPFANGASEACLRDAFRASRVPAFDGEARSLEQRFRVVSPAEPGTLTFHANVPAHVTFDGRSLGPTPQSVTASAGNHTVVFVHPELGQKEHAVNLSPGQEKTIRATFSPAETAP